MSREQDSVGVPASPGHPTAGSSTSASSAPRAAAARSLPPEYRLDAPDDEDRDRAAALLLRVLTAFLALAMGLGAGACLGHELDEQPLLTSQPPPNPWKTEGRVPVRLAAAEGLVTAEVETGPENVLRLWRDGNGVSRGTAPVRERWLRIDPDDGAAGVRFRGKLYPGSLIVEPHPDGGLRIHNWVPLEDYVQGVVAAELVLWTANDSLLEAQAIAARTYAASSLDSASLTLARPFLWDGVIDQAYRGAFEPGASERAHEIADRLERAVARTRGQFLVYGGLLVHARFHACCGGRTARAADVFGGASDAMRSVECAPCAARASSDSPRPVEAAARVATDLQGSASSALIDTDERTIRWSYTASESELARLARETKIGTRLLEMRPLEVDPSGRWLEVELSGDRAHATIGLPRLRQVLGWDKLQSGRVEDTWPKPGQPIRAGMYFEGIGSGHGVGLCQEGARHYGDPRAWRWSAERILRHYYPGASLGAR